MTAALTTADLLLEWDARRPRSRQVELGMSELGECRRRAKYRIDGYQPSNRGGSVQAVMGTAIHDKVSEILSELQAAGLIPADDLVEYEVTFAGIVGHLDRYEAGTATLRDTKSTTQRWLDKIKVQGPPLSHRWQTHAYGAALVAAGRKVRRIAIDYLARDTGEEWTWTGRFDPSVVRSALMWVQMLRVTELEFVARDHDPNSSFCKHCPFFDRCWEGRIADRDERSVLFVEHPDAVEWIGKLVDARARKTAAEADEALAKGALDALRPNDEGAETVAVDGAEYALRWIVTRPERLDTTQVRADYHAAGRPAPTKPSDKPSVRLDLVAAPAT